MPANADLSMDTRAGVRKPPKNETAGSSGKQPGAYFALQHQMSADRMNQVIRELKRQVAGEELAPEQLKGLIRAGYVYRNGDEHLLTDMGRDALAQPSVYPSADASPEKS